VETSAVCEKRSSPAGRSRSETGVRGQSLPSDGGSRDAVCRSRGGEGRDRDFRTRVIMTASASARRPRRIDVDAAGSGQGGDKLELLVIGSSRFLFVETSPFDDTGRRGRPAGVLPCPWRPPARRCRRCPKSAPTKRRPAPALRSAQAEWARARPLVSAASEGATAWEF